MPGQIQKMWPVSGAMNGENLKIVQKEQQLCLIRSVCKL